MPATKLWNWEKLFNSEELDGPCPECDRPDLITGWFQTSEFSQVRPGNCHGCKLPILLWHKLKIQSFGIGEASDYYHDFCFAKKSYLQEKLNRLVESKKAERDGSQAKSSEGCLSLLLIGMLIILLLSSASF
jgi:hypothetical protein